MFVRSGATWAQQAKLTASDAAGMDHFGNSVAVSGDTAVVGAPYDDTTAGSNAGSAYVFVRSGATWAQQAQLTASDAAGGDGFGYSVALSGDTAVVGAPGDDTSAGPEAGSAYVFASVPTSSLTCVPGTSGGGPSYLRCRATDLFGIRRIKVVDLVTRVEEQSIALSCEPPGKVTTTGFRIPDDGHSHRVVVTDCSTGVKHTLVVAPTGTVTPR